MPSQTTDVFALPDHLSAKADPALIAADARHFAAVAAALEHTLAELTDRLDTARRAPGGSGQAALDRDQEIHRLTARLRGLQRFGLDLCLGRTVAGGDTNPTVAGGDTNPTVAGGDTNPTVAGGDTNPTVAGGDTNPTVAGGDTEPLYVGRFGLTDGDGRRLLVDWRSRAAEPFFGATHGDPMGLASRRRYRWTRGRITDYWDEVFTPDGLEGHAALDDQSAFIASLGAARSPRMRDVLGTIQADQDAIIRAGSRGALVVDGGPGTGKTVVALHRAAYLLYADPRLGHRRGGVLFVGPHQPYLDYVGDVLPGLGEEGVRTCTLRDLVAEGAAAGAEPDPLVARLKSSGELVRAVDAAVAIYEEPPTETLVVETDWDVVRLRAHDWAEAFEAAAPGTSHNDARDEVWERLLEILTDQHDDEVPPEDVRRSLLRNRDLLTTFGRAWPLLDPAEVVGDLWTVPAYLRACAPWLDRDEVRLLQRADPQAWTESDLPLLDAARRRVGDPAAAHRRRRNEAAASADREQMSRVVDDLIAADDSELLVMTMLRGQDARNSLEREPVEPAVTPDALAGPFAHVLVDEAQELTDAQWQMLLQRCPSGSFTIVGDRAQARHGFVESWQQRLERVGVDGVRIASLTVNYRTPEEVMAEAEPVIRAVLPDANVPTSIRRSGVPVLHAAASELDAILDDWLAQHAEGVACVVGDPDFRAGPRVRSLAPELVKGLEFDLVVLVDPQAFGDGVEGAVDRYVAMTRATGQLVLVTSSSG